MGVNVWNMKYIPDLKIAHLALNNNRSLASTNPIDKGHICI